MALSCAEDETAPGVAPSSAALLLAVGQPYEFANSTDETHTFTAVDGSFDSGPIEPGKTWTWTSAQPGEHPVFCTIHWDRAAEEGVARVSSDAGDLDVDATLRAAMERLGTDPSGAVHDLQKVLGAPEGAAAPSHRDAARAGIGLARLANVLRFSSTILRAPARDLSVETAVRPILEDVARNAADARRRFRMIENLAGLAVQIPSLDLGIVTEEGPSVDLSGRFGEPEARLLSAIAGVLDGLAQLILAHDFSMTLTQDAVDLLTSAGLQEPEEVLALRKLGAVLAASPAALTFKNERRFLAARGRFVGALDALMGPDGNSFVAALEGTLAPEEAVQRPVALLDRNGSGELDAGDLLRAPFVGEIVLSPGSVRFLDQVPSLLESVLGALLPGAEARVALADLNPVLDFLGYRSLPNIAAVRPGAWFDRPKPLREILPVWYNVGGVVEWAIEGELSPGSGFTPDGSIVRKSDAPHFEGITVDGVGFSIPADGITPPESEADEMTPYLALRDPTLGGMLFTNLGRLDVPSAPDPAACAPDADGFCPATLFSTNALLAYIDALVDL